MALEACCVGLSLSAFAVQLRVQCVPHNHLYSNFSQCFRSVYRGDKNPSQLQAPSRQGLGEPEDLLLESTSIATAKRNNKKTVDTAAMRGLAQAAFRPFQTAHCPIQESSQRACHTCSVIYNTSS
jgi:hypothetical protein